MTVDTLTQLNFPYTATQLSDVVNRIPNNYGLLNWMNLFPSRGSGSTIIEIAYQDGTIRVLPSKERGAPATPGDRGKRKSFFLKAPHFPQEDVIKPEDIQDQIELDGTIRRPRQLADEIMRRMAIIRRKHAITREWLRMGALTGVITDGDNNTLYDLYSVFGVTKTTVDFVLGTSSTDVIGKCATLRQSIAQNLKGETMTMPGVIVSTSFFNKFVNHANVVKYWLNWQAASEYQTPRMVQPGGPLGEGGRPDQLGRWFEFQGIWWMEYYGVAPINVSGTMTSTAFVPTDYGYAFPLGTQNMFETWDVPANDLRNVNMTGQEIWVSTEMLRHGGGVEIKSESNPLPICKRIEALVEIHTSN
jgi:hypothetical protein